MITDKIFRDLRGNQILKYIPDNSVVCDIGCGSNGQFLRKISSKIKKGYGFDIKAEYYKDDKIEIRENDLEKGSIPLKDETADMVVMLAVLEHLKEPEKIIREIRRILKNNGYFCLTTPSPKAKGILEFLAFKLKIINKNDIFEHKKYFSPKEIISLLMANGFRKENITTKYFEFGLNILAFAKKD